MVKTEDLTLAALFNKTTPQVSQKVDIIHTVCFVHIEI